MKFYNREEELLILEQLYNQCEEYGKLAVLTGRRRVGKTLLAKKFVQNKKYIYFFISKKTESLLCEEFKEQIEEFIGEKLFGEITSFVELFEILLKYAKKNRYVLIIDEFQEFYSINQSIYSEIQKLWDQYKFDIKVHVIFIGSLYSLMIKIFQDSKEPLFGRADRIFYIKPFKAEVIKQILEDNSIYTNENLFYNYLLTGGMPRYEEILVEANCFSKDEIFKFVFSKHSSFLNEGKLLLVEEFGKEYGIYFSVLELIANGRTSRNEMESILERSVGGYLEKLENTYDIISKVKPVGSKKRSGRIQKYYIKDNFIKFWFRFIYRYSSIIEDENFEYMEKILRRDLSTYSGAILEKLFQELIKNTRIYGEIGNYWERGNKNEIDIVAVDKIDKRILIGEVKMNKEKINMPKLREKSKKLAEKYKTFSIEYKTFSLEDLNKLI